jgi:hypothetical protein
MILTGGDVFAQDTVSSKYFKVTIHSGVDKAALLTKLYAGYFLQLSPVFSTSDLKGKNLSELLAKALDSIYLSVSDILDIHIYSLYIELEIFPDRAALVQELGKYFDKKIEVPSFYFYDKNKIYIAFNDMTLGMLAHEVAHAIISHYFVVQPSVKVQEILSGYVEYSLNKMVK